MGIMTFYHGNIFSSPGTQWVHLDPVRELHWAEGWQSVGKPSKKIGEDASPDERLTLTRSRVSSFKHAGICNNIYVAPSARIHTRARVYAQSSLLFLSFLMSEFLSVIQFNRSRNSPTWKNSNYPALSYHKSRVQSDRINKIEPARRSRWKSSLWI